MEVNKPTENRCPSCGKFVSDEQARKNKENRI